MTIKVLHIGKYSIEKNGGIETMIRTIFKNCPAAVKNTLICFGDKNCEKKIFNSRIIINRETFKIFSQSFSFSYAKSIKNEINKHQIIHLHLPNIYGSLLVLLFKKKETKIIIHWHSDIQGKQLIYFLIKFIEKKVIQSAKYIICTSRNYAETSEPLKLFQKKIKIIPIGVSDKIGINQPFRVTAQIQHLIKKNSGKKIIITTGRLVKYKGFRYLIDAFKYLNNEKVLIIVGDGPEKKSIRTQILESKKNIFLLSNINDSDLNFLLKKSHIFCLPSISRAEAFGIVLIEAMKNSLPLITTNINGSGMNYINRNNINGIVVEKENSIELAKAINKICDNDIMRKKFSENSKILFKRKFTEKNFLEKLVELYIKN